MKGQRNLHGKLVVLCLLISFQGCASPDVFLEPNMDFASVRTVAVLPFQNLSREDHAAERVRDAFSGMLLATEAVYVLPAGEVARAISRTGPIPPDGPSAEQIKKLSAILGVDAVIAGVVREYGVVRSGAASANVVSLSLQMIEAGSGRVIWSASSTKGGITLWDRLFGGGGKPMNEVTEKVVDDLLDKLFD